MDGSALPFRQSLISMAPSQGLHNKLIRAFLLQIGLISLATLFGVFSAAKIVENVLVRYALEGEADYFWKAYAKDKAHPWPNSLNLIGYLAVDRDFSEVPKDLHRLQPGYAREKLHGRYPIVYVEDKDNARLFLVFDEEQVSDLSFYFGVVPLTLVLIFIYLFAWLAYRQTSQAISPVVKLANMVNQFNFREQRISELDLSHLRKSTDSEVTVLIDALDHFTERLELFVERERNFTRDASHELRTPLTVIKSSLALLQKRSDYRENERKAVILIDRTIHDMEGLIETLLILARGESSSLPDEDILVNDQLKTLIEQIRPTVGTAMVKVEIEEDCLLSIQAPEKILSILFANLLRNALCYTQQGLIKISIDEQTVSITDSGDGIEPEKLQKLCEPFYRGQLDGKGYGLGLAIVKRFCDRFGWSLKITSKPGKGTCVSIFFPESHCLGRK